MQTSPARQSARLKQKEERSKRRQASFRKLRSGNSSDDGDDASSYEDSEGAAYFPTPTRLNDPANNFTKVYNSYCRDANGRAAVLDCYENDFIDDSEFRQRPTVQRKGNARRQSRDLFGTKRQKKRILAESSSESDDRERQGGVAAVGVALLSRNTKRKYKRLADTSTESEEDDHESTATKFPTPSKKKHNRRRVQRGESSDTDSSSDGVQLPKRPRSVSKALRSDHSSSSDEIVNCAVFNPIDCETPPRGTSSRAKLLEQRRNSDRKIRLKQLRLHRARQQGTSISEEESDVGNDSVGREQEIETGEETDDFIVDDNTILRDSSATSSDDTE